MQGNFKNNIKCITGEKQFTDQVLQIKASIWKTVYWYSFTDKGKFIYKSIYKLIDKLIVKFLYDFLSLEEECQMYSSYNSPFL